MKFTQEDFDSLIQNMKNEPDTYRSEFSLMDLIGYTDWLYSRSEDKYDWDEYDSETRENDGGESVRSLSDVKSTQSDSERCEPDGGEFVRSSSDVKSTQSDSETSESDGGESVRSSSDVKSTQSDLERCEHDGGESVRSLSDVKSTQSDSERCEAVYHLHDLVITAFEIYPNIKELELDGFEETLDATFFERIAPSCSNIEAISFDQIDSNSVAYLANHCIKLKKISGYLKFYPKDDVFMAFIKAFPQLNSINIETACDWGLGYQIPDNVISTIADNCTDLEECVFPLQYKITDEAMAKLIRECKKLRKLDIGGCKQLGDQTCAAIVDSATLQFLRFSSFTENQLKVLRDKQGLKKIDISYLDLPSDHIMNFVQGRPELEEIIISNDHYEAGLHYQLLRNLAQLKIIQTEVEKLDVQELRRKLEHMEANQIEKDVPLLLDMETVEVLSCKEMFDKIDKDNVIRLSDIAIDSSGVMSGETMLEIVMLKLYQQSALDIKVHHKDNIVGGTDHNFNIKYPIIESYFAQLIDKGADIHSLNSMHENAATVALRKHIKHKSLRADWSLRKLLPYVTVGSDFYGRDYEGESNSPLRSNKFLLLSNFMCSRGGHLNCKSELLIRTIRKSNYTQTVEWIIEQAFKQASDGHDALLADMYRNKNGILHAISGIKVVDASLPEIDQHYLHSLRDLLRSFDGSWYEQLRKAIDNSDFSYEWVDEPSSREYCVLDYIKNRVLVYQSDTQQFLLTVSLVRKIAQRLLDKPEEDFFNRVLLGRQIMQMLDQYLQKNFKGSDSSDEADTIDDVVNNFNLSVDECTSNTIAQGQSHSSLCEAKGFFSARLCKQGNDPSQTLQHKYKQLQTINHNLGSYVQAIPGRSLAEAHILIEDMFNHFVSDVYDFDSTLKFSYDEVNRLLLENDYEGMLNVLKSMIACHGISFNAFR